MKRRWLAIAAAFLGVPVAAFAQASSPRVADERIVVHTMAGDLVLALYPDVAPAHVNQVLALAKLGIYDGTHFYRMHERFVLQVSVAADRESPLSDAHRTAIHPIRAEFSELRHQRGTLSMARNNSDPDSAETSFSIMLGSAPHLDGKYTIFGHVEAGMDVVDELVRVPVDSGRRPLTRLRIRSMEVVSQQALAGMSLAPARSIVQPAQVLTSTPAAVAVGIGLMMAIGCCGFLLAGRVAPRVVDSLLLAIVLVGAFLLLIVLIPQGRSSPRLAAVLFLGLLGVIKLMGRFERPIK